MWFWFALGSAVFAALTSILAKIGINGVNSNLATAIRTVVVVIMAWGKTEIRIAYSISRLYNEIPVKINEINSRPKEQAEEASSCLNSADLRTSVWTAGG